MGLDRLFEIQEETCCAAGCQAIPMVPGSEETVREKVLEAHRVLMSVSAENRARFSELVAQLEKG